MKNNAKQELDKDKLQNAISQHMRTIMIGAIADIEEKFGMLWGHGTNQKLTQNEQQFYELFTEVRKSILDRGNTQIRTCKQSIDPYQVEYVGYTITLALPIIKKEQKD